MRKTTISNLRSPSTTVSGRIYKLSSVPAHVVDRARRRSTFPQFERRNPRVPLTLKVHFVGGATGKWVVEVRGEKIFTDYGAAIGDVFWGVNGQ